VADQIGSVLREVNEIPGAQLKSALDDLTWNGVDQGKLEVRRMLAPAKDWLGNISSEAWNLCLPLVIYEIWSDRESHGLAVSAWGELSENERSATGVPKTDAARGYVASTMILLPQMRPYFVGVDELVVPGGPEPVEQQHLVAEDTDGSVVLSRVAGPLMPEPWRELPVEEALAYISLRYPERSFAAMNLSSGAGHPDALARYPKGDAHGLSGSDFRITLVGKNQLVDVATVGLIRGLGGGYFTGEPWRERAPREGFSAPARVTHVPPTTSAADAAFAELIALQSPARIADPYGDDATLERLGDLLAGSRIIVKKMHNVTPDWAKRRNVEVRVCSHLHDRFVIGRRGACLLGASLNGLGKQHSFIVMLDAAMQVHVAEVFELLWNASC
jgi:hypothetical protein